MAKDKDIFTPQNVYKMYNEGVSFNNQIDLYDTVENNENFFIGKQWEGVKSNGLPTPVFNFLKRVVLFQVATILSDNITMQATPLSYAVDQRYVEQVSEIITNEFSALFEQNKMGSLLREFMRNAAVDGDGCLYTYWDDSVNTGQAVKGAIRTEVLDNTSVIFGNPNERNVQKQPYIIIESKEIIEDIKHRAKENGVEEKELDGIGSAINNAMYESIPDDRLSTYLLLRRDRKTGNIFGYECTNNVVIKKEWDLNIKHYPITWLCWDYVKDCYHGMSMITGLIPNQIFVNKTFAMVQLSLMNSAFPKYVYDGTRIDRWTNQVGAAINIKGGDVNNVAKIIEPAQISPQVSQFIQSTIDYTQTFLGATSAALGDTRADNTSAIVALQRASSVPSELTRQNLYQCLEDLGSIYMDFMTNYYGRRTVKAPTPDLTGLPINSDAVSEQGMDFDFETLVDIPMSLKLDVGASSYWSEIKSMQTIENLLMLNNPEFGLKEYLERIPDGYILKKQELLDKINRQSQAMSPQMTPSNGATAPQSMPSQSTTPEVGTTEVMNQLSNLA